jgi:hypothetical protein
VDALTVAYAATLATATSLDPRSRSLASSAVALGEDGTRRIAFLTLSLASIIGGRQPDPSPFDADVKPFTYPPLPTALPLNSNKPGTSTVGQQSAAFSAYVTSLIAHIQEFNREFEDARKQVSGGCVCPASTDVALVTSLTTLNTIVASYAAVATKSTLVQYWNATVATSVTSNFNAINAYLGQFDTCIKCMLTKIVSKGARSIKQYCSGEWGYGRVKILGFSGLHFGIIEG